MTQPAATPEPLRWGTHEVPRDSVACWRLARLVVWCRQAEGEIRAATRYHEESREASLPESSPPPEKEWWRWALRPRVPSGKILLAPRLPDRPVVVKPEMPFVLLTGGEMRVYIRVPVWVRISLPELVHESLLEIPSVVLSKTWFGAITGGDLCYSLSSTARRTMAPELLQPELAVCPLQIANRSGRELRVERLRLRVGSLTLYQAEGSLWADETRVVYEGAEGVGQIESTGKMPAEARNGELISLPRDPTRRGLVESTFSSLRNLPGFGSIISG